MNINPRKAAIVGCGFVGASIAFRFLQQGLFSQLVLLDAKQEKAEGKSSKFGKRLRIALFSLVMAVCGIWGIANIVNINTVKAELDSLSNIYYNINLPSYLRNLTQLDAVNQDNMENLFQTIPEEAQPPTQIEAKSNWFDRLCEFLAGLFGG